MQLVSDGASAQLKRDWCSCAALCHHDIVSDSSLSLTLPTWPTDTANQSLIAVTDYCASTPSTTLDASVISDKGRIEVTAYLHGRLDYCNAILAGTADVEIKRLISSEYHGSFSIRNNFPGPISLFYPATLASGVAQNSFQAHVQSCLYLYKLYIPVKNFGGRPWLRASAGYPMPKVQTSIRQRSFAFYGPIVWTVCSAWQYSLSLNRFERQL